MYGNFQILPKPTALPAAAMISPTLEVKELFFVDSLAMIRLLEMIVMVFMHKKSCKGTFFF